MKSEHTICVVDDDESVRVSLALVLRLEGFRVHEYADGETFLTDAANHLPQIVILDLDLPGVSGWEVLDSPESPNVPYLIITGRQDVTLQPEYKDRVREVFKKPMRLDCIIELIRGVLKAESQENNQKHR